MNFNSLFSTFFIATNFINLMMKEVVEENIRKMEEILKNLKILDKNALKLYNLAISYFSDSKYFLEKNDLIRALECITISWAYIDALLHFKLVEIGEKYKKYFTV